MAVYPCEGCGIQFGLGRCFSLLKIHDTDQIPLCPILHHICNKPRFLTLPVLQICNSFLDTMVSGALCDTRDEMPLNTINVLSFRFLFELEYNM